MPFPFPFLLFLPSTIPNMESACRAAAYPRRRTRCLFRRRPFHWGLEPFGKMPEACRLPAFSFLLPFSHAFLPFQGESFQKCLLAAAFSTRHIHCPSFLPFLPVLHALELGRRRRHRDTVCLGVFLYRTHWTHRAIEEEDRTVGKGALGTSLSFSFFLPMHTFLFFSFSFLCALQQLGMELLPHWFLVWPVHITHRHRLARHLSPSSSSRSGGRQAGIIM